MFFNLKLIIMLFRKFDDFNIQIIFSLNPNIAPKSSVRNNYHAHRLSFWLNLIPKLHASGAIDNKLHLMNSVDHHGKFRFLY